MRHRSWDEGKAMELYIIGMTDGEIGKRVNISRESIAMWRKKEGLQANGKPGRHPKEDPGSKAAPPPPASPPPRPLELPSLKGPVELSVELDGRAFALRAPDLEGAAWIHAYAGRLLEDMRQISVKVREEADNG